jgi:hypothetical protein
MIATVAHSALLGMIWNTNSKIDVGVLRTQRHDTAERATTIRL